MPGRRAADRTCRRFAGAGGIFSATSPSSRARVHGHRSTSEQVEFQPRTSPMSFSRPASSFLLWVHLYDPHAPYAPPEPWRSRFADRPYDGEVAYAGAQVGRLLTRLEARGLTDSSIVVVAGDHGEGLGDHGESTRTLRDPDPTGEVCAETTYPAVDDSKH